MIKMCERFIHLRVCQPCLQNAGFCVPMASLLSAISS